jgi:dihydroorotase
MKKCTLIVLSLLTAMLSFAQVAATYNIVIKGGRVIDPRNNINAEMDIAVKDGKIAKLAKDIPASEGKQVVNAKGMIVSPGLIDIHGHVFWGTHADRYLSDGNSALPPDGFTFRVGVTTIVDCGGAGWKNFALFKKNVIDVSKSRVLSFLNIVGEGMRGGNFEQDINDMNPELSANTAKQYKDYIVGFKLAHFNGHNWTPTERVVEAGRLADMPVVIDFGGAKPNLSIEELFLQKLRPGDIYTHTYAELGGARETIVDEKTNTVKPFVFKARDRGIVFDVGYGGASFNFSQAIPALKQGLFPTTISTDLHTGSMNTSMKNQLDVMSKFMLMGMPLAEVIRASTWTPATVIKREELGHLSVGAVADIAILNMRKGDFGFYDKTGYKLSGKEKLECEMTIKGGSIMFDMNGIANPIYVK